MIFLGQGKTRFTYPLTMALCLLLTGTALGGCRCGKNNDNAKPGTSEKGEGGSAGDRAGSATDVTAADGVQPPSIEQFSNGWFGIIASKLPTFTEQLVPQSEGWALLYKGDFQGAAQAFSDEINVIDSMNHTAEAPELAQLRIGLGRAMYETAMLYREGHKIGLSLQNEYFTGLSKEQATPGSTGTKSDWKTRLAEQAAALTAQRELGSHQQGQQNYQANPATLMGIADEAKKDSDPSMEGLSIAMAGLAAHTAGDTKSALEYFQKAQTRGTTGALAAAYWAAKLGLNPQVAALSIPELTSLQSTMDLRLYFGTMVWSNKLAEAEAIADRIIRDQSCDFSKTQAAEKQTGTGDNAMDENRGREYYLPWTFGDLARYHFLLAARAFEPHSGTSAAAATGAAGDGDGAGDDADICTSFWLGLVKNDLGDSEDAIKFHKHFLTVASRGMTPIGELACTAFSQWRNVADMTSAARHFSAGRLSDTDAATKGSTVDMWQATLLANMPLAGLEAPHGSRNTGESSEDGAALEGAAENIDAGKAVKASAFNLQKLDQMAESAVKLPMLMETWLDSDGPSADGATAARELRLPGQMSTYFIYELACLAESCAESPLALRLLETAHDNSNIDRLSSINRPLFLLATARTNWTLKRNRRAIRLIQTLEESYPLMWQLSELMKRIDLFDAIGDRSAPVVGN